jgi:hypothetical protein
MIWFALWMSGGLLLADRAFRLRDHEKLPVGLAVGFVLQILLANMLAQVVGIPAAAWVSAGMLLLGGLALNHDRLGERLKMERPLLNIALLFLIAAATARIALGTTIFDDYAHLPTTSLMAAGDVPPHFALDPNVPYYYHYFLMLFAAQWVRVGNLLPATALDLARGVSFALAVAMAVVWARRLTGSRTAGIIGGVFTAFAGGTRWLLLLLPQGILTRVSAQVEMIGSGATSGVDLFNALQSGWGVDSGAPLDLPFAFANGINAGGVVGLLGPNSLCGLLISLVLLVTFNRWRDGWGAVVSALLLAATYLTGESDQILTTAGWGIVLVGAAVRARGLRLPGNFWRWAAVYAAGSVLGLLQGGAWTEYLLTFAARLGGAETVASYQTVGFELAAPALVSSHLGVMPFDRPYAFLAALFELGPGMLVLPLLVFYAYKALRAGRWYESALVWGGLISLGTIFVQFTGSTGVRNTSRLYGFVSLAMIYALPLVWRWASRRAAWVQTAAATVCVVTCLSGMVLGGYLLAAAPREHYGAHLQPLDVELSRRNWNQLDEGTLIFAKDPGGAVTLFGRPSNAALTWFEYKPEWQALTEQEDPAAWLAAGFDYAYVGGRTGESENNQSLEYWKTSCARLVDDAADAQGNWRALLDLRACTTK